MTKRVAVTLIHSDGKFVTLDELEAEAIERALRYFTSKGKAAKALGIGRTQLFNKIRRHGLEEVLPSKQGWTAEQRAGKVVSKRSLGLEANTTNTELDFRGIDPEEAKHWSRRLWTGGTTSGEYQGFYDIYRDGKVQAHGVTPSVKIASTAWRHARKLCNEYFSREIAPGLRKQTLQN